ESVPTFTFTPRL
nr:locustapyrokinin II, Lom-PK-II=FXPRL-amide peptide [Locusta migratoria, brain corpora cardiaca-corpora allata subesophageal ganglion, Peptide, 12 aa] [Locusta migratoria]